MIRSKTFIKKTRSGKILKVVREHYLRDDVFCSYSNCQKCHENIPIFKDGLNIKSSNSFLAGNCLIVPDTNVVLHQMDILEDESIKNLVILQTVYAEVKHRSAIAYKQLQECISNRKKSFYLFMNEFHKDTYIEREQNESSNDRNDRAIRYAVTWYQNHLKNFNIKVILLTDDIPNLEKAKDSNIYAVTTSTFVKDLENSDALLEKLAQYKATIPTSDGTSIFSEHLPLSKIQEGLRTGKYLQGTFQASRDNYLEATVDIKEHDKTILIQGLKNMNRAIQDDIVVIELLPENEWHSSSALILEDIEEKGDDIDKSEDEIIFKEIELKTEKQPCGKIVGIIKRNWRKYCGMIQKSLIDSATRHLIIPADKRLPKIRIETRQANVLEGKRIIVVIDSWPRTSRYPLGHFVRNLGEIGNKNTENEVLLLEHNIPHNTFSVAVRACLPSLPWKITKAELKNRRDLRNLTIVSVDPPGCTDIDDALHCFQLENGNLQVGVHIADVSHFIKPGTAIDLEAANRGNTVYLIDQRIDMVPELLSSNLCSLKGNEERLAFSVIWELDSEGEIIKVEFAKTAALTYAEAQAQIDDVSKCDNVTISLRLLNDLSKRLKRKRVEQGALTLASPEIRFHIDSETHDPIDVQNKQLLDTNSMVEEFMLLANISTANKILKEFPQSALLRRHPEPPSTNFEKLVKVAEYKGFELNVSSGKKLAYSLEKCIVRDNPYFNTMLRILATRCMMQAVYFSSGSLERKEYFHYGLAAPIYTHFTSPIRRYSDIIVHRLLAVSINADKSYPDLLSNKKTQILCNNLNYRHKMAQYAGRASVVLHTQIFFKDKVLLEDGYILFIRKNAIQVLIPKYGLEGTIYLDKSQSKFTYDEKNCTQKCGNVLFSIFDLIIVQISIDKRNLQHQKMILQLVKPYIEGFSVTSEEINEPPLKKRRECK